MGFMRASALGVLGALLTLSVFACNGPPQKKAEPLMPVAAVAPQPLPPMLTAVSPAGETSSGAQILIRFKNDVVPLERLESPDRVDLLAHLRLEPSMPGRFVVLTPRMVGFSGDAPLPKATRFRVTLGAGLKDLKGNVLASDYAWTFTTETLALTIAGNGISSKATEDTAPLDVKPLVEIDSNVELDLASLLAGARIGAIDASAASLELEPAPEPSASPSPLGAPGPADSGATFAYRLVPKNALPLGTKYRIEVAPGVLPLSGNLPSSTALTAYFRTHGALSLENIEGYGAPRQGGDGRFLTGSPQLDFSNPLDEKSALAALAISPAPLAGVPLARLSDDGRSIQFNGNALAPGTHYALTVAATARDVFGQTLGRDASATFDTGDLIPDIWAPSGFSIFPSGADIALNVTTTNLPERHYRSAFRTIDPKMLVTLDPSAGDSALGVLPDPAHWTVQPAVLRRNEPVDAAIPLREKLGGATGMLAYGASARTVRIPDERGKLAWQEPRFTGFVQLSNVGAFAQWFPDGGMVRLAHLSDGSPIAGARVEIYESLLDRVAKANVDPGQGPCATGSTGADGVWTLTGSTFAPCAGTSTRASSAPELLVIAREGKDWGFVRTQPWSDYAGVWTGWSAGAPNARGTILCDRQLYQPGERAEFSGFAYFERDGKLERGRSPSYTIRVTDPNGKSVEIGSRSLDPFGAFAIGWTAAKNAPTGYYAISAKGDGGEELDGQFQVAEFKPPNFKVALTLDAQTVVAGATVNAASSSTYLFGAPVSGGTTKFYVTRSRADFAPAGWDAFSFGRIWLYPEEAPDLSSDVLQRNVSLDAAGKASLAVHAGDDLPFPATYQIDAETTDASNLSVSASKQFTALPSQKLIGLRGTFVGAAGKAYSVGVIVADPAGKALEGEHVHLVLQRRESVSATQLVAGSETPHDAVHYVDVAQADVTSQASPQTAVLTPDKAGTYRVRANFAGTSADATASDALVWVTGAGEPDWGPSEQSYLTVKLDKERYRPGDVATALIESPYADADLYFAVVRHGVIFAQNLRVRNGTPHVRFTVTPEMLPNAAVEAVLVRRGPSLSAGVPAGLENLARLGFAPFDVALDAKYLGVRVSAARASLAPGATQRVAVRLRDAAGKPVAGEVVVAVVDDAVLQLSGYRFPDLVKIVYASQPVSTSFADNRRDVTLMTEKRFVDKGFGFGGGTLAGPAGTRVRTLFKPLAYWNPALRTDASGNASVEFTLPDDLTSWHVMALAATKDARFGNGETTFVATKPLVTNPILPQFARPGDRFSAGVAVSDIARKGGTYAIDATLGGDLSSIDGTTRSSHKTLGGQSDGLNAAYRFDVLVTGPQDGRETISTKLGGNADAFAVPLRVGTQDVTESVVQTGTTTARASVPLDVAADVPPFIGGLDLTLSSTLLADAVEPGERSTEARRPLRWRWLPRIAIAADALRLGRIYGIEPARARRLQSVAGGDLAVLARLGVARQRLRRLAGRAQQRPVRDGVRRDAACARLNSRGSRRGPIGARPALPRGASGRSRRRLRQERPRLPGRSAPRSARNPCLLGRQTRRLSG